jgi:hypothetical protein
MNVSVDIDGAGLAAASLTGTVAGVQYLVNWGDGSPPHTIGDPSATTHTYLPGTYEVTVNGSDGSTASAPVTFANAGPLVLSQYSNLQYDENAVGGTNIVRSAVARLVNPLPGVTYTVDWNDGTPPTTGLAADSAPVTHVYSDAGRRSATVSGDDGSSATVEFTVWLVHWDWPSVAGSATPELYYYAFNRAATVDWGDGSPSVTGRTFSNSIPHSYPANGIYTAVLTDTVDPTSVAWIQWTVSDL